jgi:hypothetical protein
MPHELGVTAVILFVVVAAIVSLDVTGLTLAQIPDFTEKNKSLSGWAVSNGGWHAVLLGIYLGVITLIFDFSLNILVFLEQLLSAIISIVADLLPDLQVYLVVLKDALTRVFFTLGVHAKLILGIITLLIVWSIYSKKIVARPELGSREDLPDVARAAYNLLYLLAEAFYIIARLLSRLRARPLPVTRGSIREFLEWQAQAAVVAVDMLALAALVKTLNVINSQLAAWGLIAIVFGVVTAIAFFAARAAQATYLRFRSVAGDSRHNDGQAALQWLVISMRMLEPLLIFYFALVLISFLIMGGADQREPVPEHSMPKHSIGFVFGAVLLLWGLVKRHSLIRIVRTALPSRDHFVGSSVVSARNNEMNPGEIGEDARNNEMNLGEIGEDFRALLRRVLRYFRDGILAVIALVVVASLVKWYSPTAEIELDTLVSYTLLVGCYILFALFFVLESCRNNVIAAMEFIHRNRSVFLFVLGALFIASVVPIFDHLADTTKAGSIDCPKTLGLTRNHIHALQASIWFGYLFFIGLAVQVFKRGGGVGDLFWEEGQPTGFAYRFCLGTLFLTGVVMAQIAAVQNFVRDWYYSLC